MGRPVDCGPDPAQLPPGEGSDVADGLDIKAEERGVRSGAEQPHLHLPAPGITGS